MSFRHPFTSRIGGMIVVGAGVLLAAAGTMRAGPESQPADRNASTSGSDPSPRDETQRKVIKSDAEWRKVLTKTQYRVTRQKWTEPAFTGTYWKTHKDGIYQCVCCNQPLFDAKTKFESGTGWPSFWAPLDKDAVSYRPDLSEPEPRTEVLCNRCDAHLGHVFGDGPAPTGSRFCMNSAALKLVDRSKAQKPGNEADQASRP